MSKRRWENHQGPMRPKSTERRAMAYSTDPIAIYAIDEDMNRKGRSTFRAALLTEMGWHSFDQIFKSIETAQRFCEGNIDQWRGQIADYKAATAA